MLLTFWLLSILFEHPCFLLSILCPLNLERNMCCERLCRQLVTMKNKEPWTCYFNKCVPVTKLFALSSSDPGYHSMFPCGSLLPPTLSSSWPAPCPQVHAGARQPFAPASPATTLWFLPFILHLTFIWLFFTVRNFLSFLMGWKFFKGKDKLGLCSTASDRKLNASN